jgi:hypothetical protein
MLKSKSIIGQIKLMQMEPLLQFLLFKTLNQQLLMSKLLMLPNPMKLLFQVYLNLQLIIKLVKLKRILLMQLCLHPQCL